MDFVDPVAANALGAGQGGGEGDEVGGVEDVHVGVGQGDAVYQFAEAVEQFAPQGGPDGFGDIKTLDGFEQPGTKVEGFAGVAYGGEMVGVQEDGDMAVGGGFIA